MPYRALRSAGREAYEVARAATPRHSRLRDQLTVIVVATVGVDLICAALAFLLERHSRETEIKTFGSALFWTSTQLLTVSSSFKNPISFGGRVLDVFMEIWAIVVIAALAGAIGASSRSAAKKLSKSPNSRSPARSAPAWRVRWPGLREEEVLADCQSEAERELRVLGHLLRRPRRREDHL